MRQALVVLATLATLLLGSAALAGEISPDLAAQLAATAPDTPVSVIVHLTEQAPVAQLTAQLDQTRATRQQRHGAIVTALQDAARAPARRCSPTSRAASATAASSASPVTGSATSSWCRPCPSEIERIAARPDVAWVEPNFTVSLIKPAREAGRRRRPRRGRHARHRHDPRRARRARAGGLARLRHRRLRRPDRVARHRRGRQPPGARVALARHRRPRLRVLARRARHRHHLPRRQQRPRHPHRRHHDRPRARRHHRRRPGRAVDRRQRHRPEREPGLRQRRHPVLPVVRRPRRQPVHRSTTCPTSSRTPGA